MSEQQLHYIIENYCTPAVCILGATGNAIALLILLQKKLRKKTTFLYMTAMACSDIIILISYCIRIIILEWFNSVTSRVYCVLIRPVFTCGLHYSALLLVAMTIEKYTSVKYPLRAAVWITRKRAVFVVIVLGIFALLVNIHQAFYVKPVFFSNYNKTFCYYESNTDYFWFESRVFKWIDASIYCFIPISSLSILNGLIVNLLLKAKEESKTMTSADVLSTVHRKRATERQITVMLLVTTTIFCACTMPIAIALIIYSLDYESISPLGWSFVVLFELINHSVNVLIYSCGCQQFRRQLKMVLCFRRTKTNSKEEPVSSQCNTI